GILHRAWQINNLTLQRVQVSLSKQSSGGASVSLANAGAAGTTASGTPAPPKQNGSSWAPDRLELRRVEVEGANLSWLSDGNLRQMRVIAEPEGEAWLIQGYGGVLRQAGWPTSSVDHVRLRWRKPELFVNEAVLKLGESEVLDVTGQVAFEG